MARPKSPKTIATNIEADYRRHKKLIEDSMKDLNSGSAAYLNRVLALAKLAQNHVQNCVDRGIIPSNLGVASHTVFEFHAVTSTAPDTRTAERKLLEEEFDKEFGYSYGDEEEQPEPPKKSKSQRSK